MTCGWFSTNPPLMCSHCIIDVWQDTPAKNTSLEGPKLGGTHCLAFICPICFPFGKCWAKSLLFSSWGGLRLRNSDPPVTTKLALCGCWLQGEARFPQMQAQPFPSRRTHHGMPIPLHHQVTMCLGEAASVVNRQSSSVCLKWTQTQRFLKEGYWCSQLQVIKHWVTEISSEAQAHVNQLPGGVLEWAFLLKKKLVF